MDAKHGVYLFFIFYSMIMFFIIVCALFGISSGLKDLYISAILKLFESGREKIEIAKRKKNARNKFDNEEEEEEDNDAPAPRAISSILWENEVTGEEVTDKKTAHCSDTDLRKFNLEDCLEYIQSGLQTIIDDEVTRCFDVDELGSWNLLTRTNCFYEYMSIRLTILWGLGFLVRYFVFFPFRLCLLGLGLGCMIVSTALVGLLPPGKLKRSANVLAMQASFHILSHSVTLHARYHNLENLPKHGICVANHTSPIDSLVLGCKSNFALKHGGLLGLMEQALSRASDHIWFDRSESSDRHTVVNLLKEHLSQPDSLPILIFPEGTCINNTSVMMFKKGSFERFGDAFWDSSRYGYAMHLFRLMTSWAVVCDVWYLPPMTQQQDETAVQFANRVKRAIAMKGGMVDLLWDGQLKRMKVKKEWKEKMQEEFSRRYKIE